MEEDLQKVIREKLKIEKENYELKQKLQSSNISFQTSNEKDLNF